MRKSFLKSISIVLIITMIGCAKRGNITGGVKDTIPPVLTGSLPKNFSTDFNKNLIKLTFNEFVKLKDIRKQLIVSPPMKNELSILPLTASKTIAIKINDTLKPNTTYSLNFGQSIADHNEGNPYNQFKYVFSTGKSIDSLSIQGRVRDAYTKDVESFVSVMLYDVNEHFKDSIVYKKPPKYITNTLDSLKTFRLENLKSGKYLLVAMKDYNGDNRYDSEKEKIGFYKKMITIPNDTVYELKLFKEKLAFKSFRPTQISRNSLLFGYQGNINSKTDCPKIVLKNKNQDFPIVITKFPKKDSLKIWYKTMIEDSTTLEVVDNKFKETYKLLLKKQKKDSLTIKPSQQQVLNFRDRFALESTTPLVHFDKSKMDLTSKENQKIDFTLDYDEFNQLLYFNFDKKPEEEYKFKFLKGAFKDLFENKSDSLDVRLNTKSLADYGNLVVSLENVKKFPVIVELTNEKGDTIAIEYAEENTKLNFNLLEPAKYTLRAIYDENKNKKYDSGNYLEKRYPEDVIYLSKELDIRANWDIIQVFDLSIPYAPENKSKKKKT